jgi:hypothetical protein
MSKRGSHRRRLPWLAAPAYMFLSTCAAQAAAVLTAAVPCGVARDNATVAAVYCTITGGYPNNVWAIKGTFSTGARPYYGLTWAPTRQLWASQEERWDTCQARVGTDQYGNWKGHIFVRLEKTAPPGHIDFRISAVPLTPIGDPGPTVSPWYETNAVTMAPDGNGAWFQGHAYTDPKCTQPANGVIVRAINISGGIAGSYITQYSAMPDGQMATDLGAFRFAVPSGRINEIAGRTRDNQPVTLYCRTVGPWIIPPGETASVDAIPWGDVNGDAAMDAHDVALALRIASGVCAGPAAYSMRADVWPDTPDNAVTLQDAVCIARRLYLH